MPNGNVSIVLQQEVNHILAEPVYNQNLYDIRVVNMKRG